MKRRWKAPAGLDRVWVIFRRRGYTRPGRVVWVSRHAVLVHVYYRWSITPGLLFTRFLSDSAEKQREVVAELLGSKPMKRRQRPGEGAPVPPHAEYADLLESNPALAAWMTDAQFEDGATRVGGWFSVYCRGGLWVATMKDNAEKLVLSLTAPTWTLLLSLMEHSLLDPHAPWRHDEHAQEVQKKGKRN